MAKTRAERSQEQAEQKHRAWSDFLPKLRATQSFTEAQQLVANSPRPDSPGRSFYMNLGLFLKSFSVPGGSSYAEKAEYLRLIREFNKSKILKPGVLEQVEKALQVAMEQQGN